MRRSLHSMLSAALCAAFFAQSTGAADLTPIFARAVVPPPPGRMAASPLIAPTPGPIKPAQEKSVKPMGEPWLAEAIIVARWVKQRLTAAPAAVVEAALAAAQLAAILQYRSELKPMRPRFVGEWVGKGPVLARVDYLKPFGVTSGEAKGFRVKLSDGYERLFPNRGPIPNSLMRELPLYFVGDSVDVEVNVRNTGLTPLTNLIVAAVQEEHTASGGAGEALTSPVINGVSSIAPGATAVLRWRIKLSSRGREAVNFEQTHLRVSGQDPAGSETVLLDQAQAGIVDPPGAL